jgi:hypothetical protein
MLGVTAPTAMIVATLLADPPAVPYRHAVSLLHGWAPVVVQTVTPPSCVGDYRTH